MPKKTLNLIEETGNDALIQVKRNQPILFDTLTGWAQAEPAAQTHRTVDIGRRNRIESRQATVRYLSTRPCYCPPLMFATVLQGRTLSKFIYRKPFEMNGKEVFEFSLPASIRFFEIERNVYIVNGISIQANMKLEVEDYTVHRLSKDRIELVCNKFSAKHGVTH